MRKIVLTAAMIFTAVVSSAQDSGYQFNTIVNQKATSVKNQASTGTCWCFAATSFMESELIRMGKGEFDLSEMYIVRQKYMNQLEDNFLRNGKGNIGEGSLAHTFKNAYKKVGIVPEEVYAGICYDSKTHNHGELTGYMTAIADVAVKRKSRSPQYNRLMNYLFDQYLGEIPRQFEYKGKKYTPEGFTKSLGLNMDDYIEITSFTHKPYYKPFAVEVPDNWEHEQMYNVPLDEMIEIMNQALKSGYTICWDGDVSEKGFGYRHGVAINPELEKVEDYSTTDRARFEKMTSQERTNEAFKFAKPFPEVKVTPEIRQEGYEKFVTTDDHLMHITGIAEDENGTKYYITKNSWNSDSNKFGGYLNMSESYVRAKTISVMIHKDALSKDLRKKLGL